MQGGGAQTELCRAHAALGLQGLARVLEAARLLPSGHPAIARAAQAGADDLRRAIAGRPAIRLTVSGDHLLLDDAELGEHGMLRPLAELLHAMDLMALELRDSLTSDSLVALATALQRTQQRRLVGQAAAERINADATDARVVPADYSALQLAQGPGSSPQTCWKDLARTVSEALETGAAMPVADLADRVSSAVDSAPDAVADLRDQLARVAATVGRAPAHAEATLGRVREFVAALSPGARQALLRINPEGPEQALELLADLADVLPTDDVLDALGTLEASPNRLSTNALRLFKKMARVATGHPAHRARVEEILSRWRGRGRIETLHDSLNEIFRARTVREYVPDDYRARLARLTADPGPPVTTPHDDTDPASFALHAAEVAALVAADHPSAPCHGVFERLTASLDTLLKAGRIHTVVVALEAAAHAPTGDERTRIAAGRFIDAATSRRAIGLALAAAAGNPELLTSLERLVAASGDTLAAVLRGRLGSRPDAAAGLEPLLRALPPDAAADAIQPALDSPDPATRREAYRIAAAVLTSWPPALLERAMGEPDPLLQALAFERLSQRHDPASLTLLASIVARRRGAPIVSPGLADRAAAVLLNEGVSGLRLLSDALRELCGEIRPSRAAAARRLARLLESHRHDRSVRRALIRWRWCIARLVSAVRWR
jgi:hypothetical protein